VKALDISFQQLIDNAVNLALIRERPKLIASIRAELRAEAMEPAFWSPADVRRHARCASQTVFNDIASGALSAFAEEDPRRERAGIPGKRWRIKPEDARRWATKRGFSNNGGAKS